MFLVTEYFCIYWATVALVSLCAVEVMYFLVLYFFTWCLIVPESVVTHLELDLLMS